MGGPYLFASLIFIAVALVFWTVWRLAPHRDPVEERLRSYGWQSDLDLDLDSNQHARPRFALTQRIVYALGRGPSLAQALARADMPLTVAEFVLLVVALSMAGMALGVWRQNLLVGVGLGLLLGAAPFMYLRRRQSKRLRQLSQQLPDVMTLLIGGLRAGYGLNQALEALVEKMPAPSSTEFGRVLKAVSLGVPIQRALQEMAKRAGSDDLALIVTAITIQYEMGGNLAGVLETISDTVRERIRIMREIRVLTAQQRMTGYILAGFPIVLAIGLFLVQPKYFAPFFKPGPLQLLPILALVMLVIGFFIIRRIVDIDV